MDVIREYVKRRGPEIVKEYSDVEAVIAQNIPSADSSLVE